MYNLEHLPTWVSLFNDAQKIKEYDDLNITFRLLRVKVETNKIITDDDDVEFERLIKVQCKRVVSDRFNEIINKIKTRKTSGQNFTKNIKTIEKIRCKGEMDLETDAYFQLFIDLDYQEKLVDEKISNEEKQNKNSWNMLYIGIILGQILTIITTVITTIIMKLFLK